ncbi:MAG: hypothetical protein ABGW77_02685, partial [Campylobacterales bacterium]
PSEGYRWVEREPLQFLDLYFHRNDIPHRPSFEPVLWAKKELPSPDYLPPNLPFQLRILILLPPGEGHLHFLYRCQNCLQKFPFYLERCPKCGSLFLFKPLLKIEPPVLSDNLKLEI